MKTLGDIGELAAIERITRSLRQKANVLVGPGDDCAVIKSPKGDLVLKSDPVIQGVHFLKGTLPAAIGHKAVGRVLSDFAAMGAKPEWILLNIAATAKERISTLDGIYKGASALASKHGVAIVGGDVSAGHALEINAFAAGTVPRGAAVLRSGARAGDRIFVTGALGGSFKGRHLNFEPRVQEGIFLRSWASSMIDISDGLATDLRHIAEMSHVGALVSAPAIPLSSATKHLANMDRVKAAMCDGEDFELLFTVPLRKVAMFRKAWKKRFSLPCSMVGEIIREEGNLGLLEPSGNLRLVCDKAFQHFKTSLKRR